MNQKGFSPLFIILGIILVIGIVGGAYYLGKSQSVKPEAVPSPNPVATSQIPQPTPASSPTSETANWKIYTNKKYHYSIEYPFSWFICNSDETSIFINSQQTDCYSAGSNDVSIFVDNKSDLTAQFELRKSNTSKLSQINFAGVEATKSAETGNIYIFNGDYLYTVNGWTRLNPSTDNVANINQVLSTFKFTK